MGESFAKTWTRQTRGFAQKRVMPQRDHAEVLVFAASRA